MATSHAASIDAGLLGVGRVKHVVQRAACRLDGACRSIASEITAVAAITAITDITDIAHDTPTCHLTSLWRWWFPCPMGKILQKVSVCRM